MQCCRIESAFCHTAIYVADDQNSINSVQIAQNRPSAILIVDARTFVISLIYGSLPRNRARQASHPLF